MCGRYTLLADELQVRNRFNIPSNILEYMTSYNIAPGQNVLAVIYDGTNRRAGYLRWGLVPSWAKDERIGYKMINARSETAHEKPSFKNLLVRKRCLIIADSFYEWQQTESEKIVNRIQLSDHGLFGFAGLWDKWQQADQVIFTCTLLTKDANDFMRPIHHRMPIIVPHHKEDEWLKNSFNEPLEVQQFVRGLEDPELKRYVVSDYVNHAKHNDATCIAPLAK